MTTALRRKGLDVLCGVFLLASALGGCADVAAIKPSCDFAHTDLCYIMMTENSKHLSQALPAAPSSTACAFDGRDFSRAETFAFLPVQLYTPTAWTQQNDLPFYRLFVSPQKIAR